MRLDPEQLAAIPLFDTLPDEERSQIATWFQPRTVGPGQVITGEGGFGYTFFILEDGTAAVTSGDKQVGMLGPGDYFGEMAILGDGRRMATVTTTSDVTLLVLFGTEFRPLQQELPDIAARIEEKMRERLPTLT